ncbi:uncharacterized protein B0H18DRAFT_970690 [Fomitopsis serialis]|uniref:uncharacterized protein n=1 Tax=Fomitopsis serialis TaxID=139415 RepID=UPI002007C6D2|nr:uncharacterized protein B0H18DRAFT_970690 [Neoantrodia serialis]KAH9937451.1 hypothetical protein B0H18DRAFT_970690 [Neoantrodia serialis]
MADTATLNQPVDTNKVEAANDADTISPSRTSPDKGHSLPMSLSPGSALSPLRGSPANGTNSNAAAPGVPHQKKFTHSNINKKFLEKTHSSSPSGQTLSTSVTAKTGSATPKPSLQTSVSHSRLVTAKLTATAQSSTTGPGCTASASGATNSPGYAPQPPPAGKVIQPQPRGATEMFVSSVKRDSSGKPAWSSARSAASVVNKLDAAANDFPTAAEVAQGHASKLTEKKEAAQAAAAQQQAMTAQADTFRGVHLDPNAHHWDEMEEDDDNFLDGVIEFGDGRQYKIEATEVSKQPLSSKDAPGSAGGDEDPGPPAESQGGEICDDFDRSWPRTRLTTNFTNGQREHFANAAPSSASSQSVHSPSESKVLFNERSNRLEPYSSSHPPHRPGPGPGPGAQTSYFVRRGSRSDQVVSPTESRGGRDMPPHVHSQNVQLLQKGPSSIDRRHDGPRPAGEPVGPFSRNYERDVHRHETQPPPAFARTPSHGYQGRTNDHRVHTRPPRMSAMPPPPLPIHAARDPQRELSRQLPPHLSEMRSPQHGGRAPLSPDAHRRETSGLTAEPPPDTSRPVVVSADSQAVASPILPTDSAPPSAAPVVDLNEVHKKEMQSAAERARLRRQQEEEERERERERARKKAAELEPRLKAKEEQGKLAATSVSETQVIGVIEDAVRSAQQSAGATEPLTPDSVPPSASKPVFSRSSSSTGMARPLQGRRMSSTAMAGQDQLSPAMESDSWRTSALPPPPLPLLAEVESLHLRGGDDVEVVDFSDMGKFVGAETIAEPTLSERSSIRPPRASAVDFFEDDASASGLSLPVAQSDDGSWRRKPMIHDSSTHAAEGTGSTVLKEHLRVQIIPPDTSGPPGNSLVVPVHSGTNHMLQGHHGHGPQRSPLTPSYREAPMSALNDVISRIKGALDDMHPKEDPPKPDKWLPPALRPKQGGPDIALPSEVFDVTGKEPPRSPKPAWNAFTVKLSKATSPRLPPIRPKQLHSFRSATFVWSAIYSWVPPIGGNPRRDVAVDDHLFHESPGSKGPHARYRVALPHKRPPIPPGESGSAGPVVHLPPKPASTRSAKPVSCEPETPSWRRPAPNSAQLVQDAANVHPGLDTTSRSPPPESEPTSPSRLPITNLVGSGVASHRDAKVDDAAQPVSVSFVVSSEIDEPNAVESTASRENTTQTRAQSGSRPVEGPSGRSDGSKPLAEQPAITSSVTTSTFDKHVSQLGQTSSPVVANGFTSRGVPDPELLKAVWSQTSDKAALPSVNSLEGIADDLTAVSFSLQDVKSEDGGTPPPSGSGPARMSSYDVTRAFQQVPTSSVKSPQRNTILPPGWALPPPASLRPPYPYPSPVLSHSPSPTVVYPQMAPSPIPRPMMVNGPPSPYAQPVWMPIGGPQPQTNLMRPMTSSYAPPFVPYPSPGPVPLYISSGMPNPQQPPNGVQGRGAMMSPMMQPAHALYSSSPVMMHSPSGMHAQPPHGYTPAPPNRGQMRGNFEHASGGSSIPAPTGHPPQQPPYPTTPAYSARPTW